MPQLKIPAPYQGPTQGRSLIDVDGSTVRECLDSASARYPGFREQIFDPHGDVHPFVTLFLNGDELGRGALDHSVTDGDRVEILAAIAGG
jgi:molybdopterin converting factor small subunit